MTILIEFKNKSQEAQEVQWYKLNWRTKTLILPHENIALREIRTLTIDTGSKTFEMFNGGK